MAVVTLAVASLVVAAGSAYMAHKAQVKAAREQKKANDIQSAQGQVDAAAQRRAQVRQERVRRAQIDQQSRNTGVSMSSGELGSTSALGTQIGNNIASISQSQVTANGVTSRLQAAADATSNAQTWAQVGSVAQSSFNIFSQTNEFKKFSNNVFGS